MPARVLSGIAKDEFGLPLAGHVVEVRAERQEPAGEQARETEASVVTGEDGRFHFQQLEPGRKQLVLRGPGAGDIWEHRIDPLLQSGYRLKSPERELILDLSASGVEGLELTSDGHHDVLVTARIVDDLGRPVRFRTVDLIGLGGRATPADVMQGLSEHEAESLGLSDEEGQVSTTVTLEKPCDPELRVGDPPLWMQPLELEVPDPMFHAGFMPARLHLTPSAMALDVGTVVVSRMAGLAVTLRDDEDGQPVEEAMVRMTCTGGAEVAANITATADEEGRCTLWSARAFGRYELSIEAPGYWPLDVSGELRAEDCPETLELILKRKERTR